jgi:hypothetical protein
MILQVVSIIDKVMETMGTYSRLVTDFKIVLLEMFASSPESPEECLAFWSGIHCRGNDRLSRYNRFKVESGSNVWKWRKTRVVWLIRMDV